MSNCKYCNNEMTNDGDFCGKCGFINFNEGEDVTNRLLKQFKYVFTNPVAFIRTSRLINPIFTGSAAGLIAIIEFILIQFLGRKLHLELPALYTIIITLAIAATLALFMFLISHGIYKKNIDFMVCFNLTLSVQLIYSITIFIGGILGTIVSPYLFWAISVLAAIVALLLTYQGIKDCVQADTMKHLITVIGSYAGTSFVIFLILKALFKNALRTIF